MDVKQTAGELIGKLAAVIGGVATAMSFDQLLGLAIGLGGVSATWWLAIMRNRREARRLSMAVEEHEMRVEMARRGMPIKEENEIEGDEAA